MSCGGKQAAPLAVSQPGETGVESGDGQGGDKGVLQQQNNETKQREPQRSAQERSPESLARLECSSRGCARGEVGEYGLEWTCVVVQASSCAAERGGVLRRPRVCDERQQYVRRSQTARRRVRYIGEESVYVVCGGVHDQRTKERRGVCAVRHKVRRASDDAC